MFTKQEQTELYKGSIASLRAVIRLTIKEVVEQQSEEWMEASDFAQMVADVISDRQIVNDVAFMQVIKEELLRIDAISIFGGSLYQLTDQLRETFETFNQSLNEAYTDAFRSLEEAVLKGYEALWEADVQSRQLEESLAIEIVEGSPYEDVEAVRKAIRTGDVMVVQKPETELVTIGYTPPSERPYTSLSNGMFALYNTKSN